MHRIWIVGLLAAALLFPAGALAAGGKVVFASNRADGDRELYVVNGDGTGEHRLTFNNLFERGPVWSPDASRIAFAADDFTTGNWDIYTVDASGGDLRRLTTDAERDDNPQWTSDGRIVWQHGPFNCPCEGWIMNADGSGQARIPLPGNVLTPAPAPNGPRLAYASSNGGSWSLHVALLNGKGDRQLTNGPPAFGDFQPRWSPDGSRIAFLRDSTFGNNDVFTVNPGGQDLRQLTATPINEFWESWSPDGQSIVYDTAEDGWRIHRVTLDGTITSVNTDPTAPFTDTFDEPFRDASMWYQDDEGGTIGLQEGRLLATVFGSSNPSGPFSQVIEQWGAKCQLAGDFDMQVDYALLAWPPHSGYFTALSAMLADGAVARQSGPWDSPFDEQYSSWANITVPFTSNAANTTDLSGSMRLTRRNGVLSGFYRSPGGDWTLLLSTPGVTGTAVYGLGLSAQAWDFAHLTGTVAFDNFQLNSGALSCPSWWQDYGPDVSS